MSKHGSHVGRTTDHGKVVAWLGKGKYRVVCNCGALMIVTTTQARERSLACPSCWIEYQSANGKRAKGWKLRPYVHNPKPKRVRKPSPVNVG